jgi:uncharacterized protein (TIGR00252 family)
MKHNDDGRLAEDKVAEYLSQHGYKVIDRNWKTKKCEIDIVAQKGDQLSFVEVKYRSKSDHGEGFDYITDSKLRQMAFAADYWVAQHNWEGEYLLSGASVSGIDFAIEFIEEL